MREVVSIADQRYLCSLQERVIHLDLSNVDRILSLPVMEGSACMMDLITEAETRLLVLNVSHRVRWSMCVMLQLLPCSAVPSTTS